MQLNFTCYISYIYQNGEHRLSKQTPLSKIKRCKENMNNKRVILVLFTPFKVRIAPNVLQLLHMADFYVNLCTCKSLVNTLGRVVEQLAAWVPCQANKSQQSRSKYDQFVL